MVFESKSKAENFIKFNTEEILNQSGKVPERSYYCSFCCGWLVMSIAENEKGIERDKRDEQLWAKIKKSNSSFMSRNKMKKIRHLPTDKINEVNFPNSKWVYFKITC